LVFACRPEKKEVIQPEKVVEETEIFLSSEEKKGAELLDKCLKAHGGLEKWKSFEGLQYNLNDNGKIVYQLTHLKDRRAYLKSKKYTVGFDGNVAWALPDAKKVSGKSAAFYYNLDFYFVGIPFLLTDPGVHVSDSGEQNLNGKYYDVLKVSFGKEIGFTPDDVYFMYLDQETHLLRILTYSISYLNKENAPVNSAKVYSDYINVQELQMPAKMENFEWEDGKIGASKNHVRLFSDFKFLKEITDETLFEVPEGAVTEILRD